MQVRPGGASAQRDVRLRRDCIAWSSAAGKAGNTMTDESAQGTESPPADVKYLVIVGGLLLLIIVALAVLWMNERNGRIAAQRELARLRAAQSGALGSLMNDPGWRIAPPGGARAVNREDLPRKAVTLDGRKTSALQISAGAGARFGFQEGDVILVAEEPPQSTTAPVRP